MEHDPNGKGHLPSRVPVMRLLGSPVQEIFCPASLVFCAPSAQKTGTYIGLSPFVNDSVTFRGVTSGPACPNDLRAEPAQRPR